LFGVRANLAIYGHGDERGDEIQTPRWVARPFPVLRRCALLAGVAAGSAATPAIYWRIGSPGVSTSFTWTGAQQAAGAVVRHSDVGSGTVTVRPSLPGGTPDPRRPYVNGDRVTI